MRPLLAIFAIASLLILCIIPDGSSDASEMCSDGTVYDYETHGSGHPDYYCVITSVITEQSVLHVPSVLEGYDVRSYASNAFVGCMMEAVIIPKNLKGIEEEAFAGCTNLKDVYFMGDRPEMESFPEGVTIHTIPGAKGWSDTENIEVVEEEGIEYAILPDGAVVIGGVPEEGMLSVKDRVKGASVVKIDDYAFAGIMQDDGTVERRADIVSVALPDGLVSIGQRAFYYNDLKEISTPDSVVDIQDEAFRACYLLDNVRFSDNLEYIGFEAFRDCHSITDLTIPDTVDHLGDGAFYICEGLETLRIGTDIGPRMFGYCVSLREVTLDDPVKDIGYASFYQCESLESISVPDSVREIGGEAFRDCISLKQMDLNNVESIGRMAFRGCESLKSLTIPSTVASLEGYAFADCISLKKIEALGKAPAGDDTVFLNVDATVHCGADAVDSWESSDFGLKVVGDLDGNDDYTVLVTVVIAAMILISVVISLILRKR